MNIGCMILILKINREIVLKVDYSNIITFIKIINLFSMFNMKVSNQYV